MAKTLRLPAGWYLDRHWRASDGSIYAAAWSPDGGLFAVGAFDNRTRLWSRIGTPNRSLARHTQPVVAVAFRPDGKVLATSSQDELVCLWDLASDAAPRELKGHRDFVYALSWSLTGGFLATGSDDRTIRVWDADTLHCLRTIRARAAVKSLFTLPDGNKFLAGCLDGGLFIGSFDNDGVSELDAGIDAQVSAAVLTGQSLIVGTSRGLVVADVRQLKNQRWLLDPRSKVVALSLSAGEDILAARTQNGTHLWKVTDWVQLGLFRNPSELRSAALSFSPTSDIVLTTGLDGHDVVLLALDPQLARSVACRAPMKGGHLCGRPLVDSEGCRFHSPNHEYSDRDREDLEELILNTATTDPVDLTGFRVPAIPLRGRLFSRQIVFDRAVFNSFLDLSGTSFCEGLSFKNARINAGLHLDDSVVAKEAVFDGTWAASLSAERATFVRGVSFVEFKCDGRMNLSGAHFGGDLRVERAKLLGGLYLREARIGMDFTCDDVVIGQIGDDYSSLDLSHVSFARPDRTRLQSLNRTHDAIPLSIRLANSDIERAKFHNINWAQRNGRLCLQDELDVVRGWEPESARRVVASAYRQLMKSLDESREYDAAEECFCALLEVRASDRRTDPISRMVINAYGLASNFGTSYARATVVLVVLVFAVFPLLFWLGFAAAGNARESGFSDAVLCSIETASLSSDKGCRLTSELGTAIKFAERVLAPSQVALLLLAFRRRFRR